MGGVVGQQKVVGQENLDARAFPDGYSGDVGPIYFVELRDSTCVAGANSTVDT